VTISFLSSSLHSLVQSSQVKVGNESLSLHRNSARSQLLKRYRGDRFGVFNAGQA